MDLPMFEIGESEYLIFAELPIEVKGGSMSMVTLIETKHLQWSSDID